MIRRARITERGAMLGARLLRARWFVRAPIWIYRAHLGFLMGSRLLLLEHIGRRSGIRRQVVLEVVDRPEPGKYVVASGFGERSQWYRNILATPEVRVSVGRHRLRPASATVLSAAESQAAIDSYARRHPHAWRALRPVFEETLGHTLDQGGTVLPLVCLDTRSVPVQSPQSETAP